MNRREARDSSGTDAGHSRQINESPTFTVGNFFKSSRLVKGIEFEEAARATNIRPRMLRALEEDDLVRLPADVYVRGFVKIYAEYLGLDPVEGLALYNRQAADRKGGFGDFDAAKVSRLKSSDDRPENQPSKWQLLALVVVVCLVGFGIYRQFFRSQLPEKGRQQKMETALASPASLKADPSLVASVPQDGTPSAASLDAEPPPDDGSGAGEPSTPADEQESRYVLSVHFTEKTWLWIQLDGGKAHEFAFEAGEQRVWKADKAIDLYLGNAGGVQIMLNGKTFPKLGESGQTKKISLPHDFPGITADGS